MLADGFDELHLGDLFFEELDEQCFVVGALVFSQEGAEGSRVLLVTEVSR